jgi:mono/diheme cytochrome c family protein
MDIQRPQTWVIGYRLVTVGLVALSWPLAFAAAEAIGPQPSVPQAADLEFFEAKVRPLLVQHCAECHSRAAGDPEGGLSFDSHADFQAAEGVAVAVRLAAWHIGDVVQFCGRLLR